MSSVLQNYRQLKTKIAAAVWPEGAGEVVIGNRVYLSTASPEVEERTPVHWVAIAPGGWTSDPDDPSLGMQDFVVSVITGVAGDPFGEASLIGGARTGDTSNYGKGSTKGRGSLEVESALWSALSLLGPKDGVSAVAALASADAVAAVEDEHGSGSVGRRYVVSCRCTMVDDYPSPQEFVATGGVGQIVCTWALPPSRFDRRQIVLRYASGATPPTSATAGSPATLSGDLATSVTLTLAAGTWSLALFCGYNPNGRSANEHFSPQDLGSYRASVTVT